MASGRLTFLYPHLLRAAAGPVPSLNAIPISVACQGPGPGTGSRGTRAVGATARVSGRRTMRVSARMNSSFAKRAGKAVEPLDWEKQQQQQQQGAQQAETANAVVDGAEGDVKGTGAETEQAAEKGNKKELGKEGQGPTKPDIGRQYFEDLKKEKGEKERELQAASTGAVVGANEKAASETSTNTSTKTSTNPATMSQTRSSQSPVTDSSEAHHVEPERAAERTHTSHNHHRKRNGAKPKTLEAAYLAGTPHSAAGASGASGASRERSASEPGAGASPGAGPGTGPGSGPLPAQQPAQRYIHHFDSYSLVKQLSGGGYTSEQATTSMKAIRGLLARNLDVAQETLVSKSDVENESYLFSAACSELSAEITKNRRSQDEQMRQQRTHLQHEVDILTQRLNQEVLTLNDNVRGLFNDRRMAVREQQKTVDSAIQQINYKMSIMLSSDSKSEIEGVRWILIRRSVVGIIFMAILTLGTLRYATYVSHERAREAEREREKERERERERSKGGLGLQHAGHVGVAGEGTG